MGLIPLLVAGQLDPVAAKAGGLAHRPLEEKTTDSRSPPPGMNVHGLNLRASTSPRLEVAEHDELADPDHLALYLCYQQLTTGRGINFDQRLPVAVHVPGIFPADIQRSEIEQFDQAG
jgi:hypothetical protein